MTLDPKYIPMFDHPKIQEGWKPEKGDRYFDHAYGLRVWNGLTYCSDPKPVFLPTTDQMAEMWIKKTGLTAWHFPHYVHMMTREDTGGHYDTETMIDWPLPIIVLAFIMHDLHGLRWSEGEGWI